MAPKPQPFGKHDDEDEETDLLRGRWPRNRPKPGKDVEDDLLPFGIKADCRTMAAAVACVLLVGIVLIKAWQCVAFGFCFLSGLFLGLCSIFGTPR